MGSGEPAGLASERETTPHIRDDGLPDGRNHSRAPSRILGFGGQPACLRYQTST